MIHYTEFKVFLNQSDTQITLAGITEFCFHFGNYVMRSCSILQVPLYIILSLSHFGYFPFEYIRARL